MEEESVIAAIEIVGTNMVEKIALKLLEIS